MAKAGLAPKDRAQIGEFIGVNGRGRSCDTGIERLWSEVSKPPSKTPFESRRSPAGGFFLSGGTLGDLAVGGAGIEPGLNLIGRPRSAIWSEKGAGWKVVIFDPAGESGAVVDDPPGF
jgi:hypothetical protein